MTLHHVLLAEWWCGCRSCFHRKLTLLAVVGALVVVAAIRWIR